MCLICVDVMKDRMTPIEISRAYQEMEIPSEHIGDILAVLDEKNLLELVGDELFKGVWDEIRG